MTGSEFESRSYQGPVTQATTVFGLGAGWGAGLRIFFGPNIAYANMA